MTCAYVIFLHAYTHGVRVGGWGGGRSGGPQFRVSSKEFVESAQNLTQEKSQGGCRAKHVTVIQDMRVGPLCSSPFFPSPIEAIYTSDHFQAECRILHIYTSMLGRVYINHPGAANAAHFTGG